jgi:hypothetical protein
MADRRELQAEKNRVLELYNAQKVKMEKAGSSIEQLSRLNQLKNNKIEQLEEQYGDALNKLNKGKNVTVSGGTTSGMELNQSKLPDVSKQKGLGKESIFKRLKGGKGALVAGLLGAGASALLPEDSYAADVAERIGKASEEVDPMAQAQKFSEGLASPEDIMQKAAELKARKAYEKSPAFSNLRNRLQKKMGQ